MSAADPGERGELVVAPLVLRKIVEHASDQVRGTLHRGRRVAGVDVGEAGPRARVGTANGTVDVRLDLTCAYPRPVRDTVAEVRERVTAELERLTGHRVRSLAITVSGLVAAPASRTESARVR